LRDGHVFSIYQDLAGALWIGTSDGLDRLDVASGRFFHYPHPSDKPGTYDIWGLYEDGQGDFLVGCAAGLYKLDRSTGRFSLFPKSPTGLGYRDIEWFAQDRSGSPWLSLRYEGSFGSLNTKTGELRRYALRAGGSPKDHFISLEQRPD
jgi:ligand-binding sensor domain-containing protein